MDDAKIKEEFEKGKSDPRNTVSANYQSLIAHYDAVDKAAAIGFYMKCKKAERLAKIEVLEGKISILHEVIKHGENLGYMAYIHDLEREVSELKASQ